MDKSYVVELNEFGKQSLAGSSAGKLLLRRPGRLLCSHIDEAGPLLQMNVIPPEGSKLGSKVELRIPYEFVLCIATALDEKTVGLLSGEEEMG